MGQIEVIDSLEFLKKFKEYEFNLLYADPPYALGSDITIRPDGKVDYAKASDFMNKWDMPNGDYWEKWFKEAFRVTKHGGYVVMFGIDRQLLLFKYYAALAGFEEHQSLYWYFISSFPKATDLSKAIDKQLGVERPVIKSVEMHNIKKGALLEASDSEIKKENQNDTYNYTAPGSELAKKYDGYKYSVAPLKQTNETIMVFMKPTKNKGVVHDVLAYENGDKTINVSALDIANNRVGENKREQFSGRSTHGDVYNEYPQDNAHTEEVEGRFPAQTFVDEKISSSLGNSARILNVCNYNKEDLELYYYETKVNQKERNAGLDEFSKQLSAASEFRPNHLEKANEGADGNPYGRWKPLKNNHPTLKPIELNYRILKLFKTPDEQKICYPFAGSGSEIIGGIKAGFNNWVGCELSPEYVDIAHARINYWTKELQDKKTIFD